MPDYYTPVGTLFDKYRTVFEEILTAGGNMNLVMSDKLWANVLAPAHSAYPSSAIGRDFLIKLEYMPKILTGVVEDGDFRNDFGLYGGDGWQTFGDNTLRQSPSTSFPSAMDSPYPRPHSFTIGLATINTNLPLSMGMLMADAMNPVVGKAVAMHLQGFTENLAKRAANSWYLNGANNYRLSQMGPSTGDGAYVIGNSTARTITFYPPDHTSARYDPGQLVDIFNGTTRVNELAGERIRLIVDKVDEISNRVVIKVDPNTNILSNANYDLLFTTTTIGESGYVVYMNSYNAAASRFKQVFGYNDWMKSSGNLLGTNAIGNTIDVDTHPQFKTIYKSMGGASLSEHDMRMILDMFDRSTRRFGHMLDTLWTTQGVIRAWEYTKIGRETLDRTGRLSSLQNEGSQEGVKFHHGGRTYDLLTTEMEGYGRLVGIRKAGNLKIAEPPPIPGATLGGGMAPPGMRLQLVAPILSGTSSIRMPVRQGGTGDLQDMAEIPGTMAMQRIFDVQPAGLIVDNIDEKKIFADD